MAERESSKSMRVRDLCRQLKPVIGAQAERIWVAYVIENETGKTQIHEYLEILAAQHFHGTLEALGPGLLPPRAVDADGEYRLGTVTFNGRSLYPFGLRENEWTQHVGIFGRSGAGKTNLGFLVVQELLAKGKVVLVLDWKRSYRDLLALPGFESMAVYTVGRDVSPLSFNPLIPPTGTPPQTWLKKLISVVAHAYLLGDGVAYLLQEAIDQVYGAAGVYDGAPSRWPTFRDVLEVLKKRPVVGREAAWLSSALRALASLCFGEMDTLVNQADRRLNRLFDRSAILELDALTQSDKVFVAQIILLYQHALRMNESQREVFQSCVLIEEAHHVLSGERHNLLGGQSPVELAFREIREFGTSIVFLDQMPSTISPFALANTYAAICFNATHRADVAAMNQAMMLPDEEKGALVELQIGEAVVRLQGRSVKPFKIRVPEFAIRKGTVTDTMVRTHMHALTEPGSDGSFQPSVAEALVQTTASPAPRSISVESGSVLEQSFLQDVAGFPDSGVAERYRRLRLSVRQGQKAKDALVGKGLIQEQIQIIKNGKLRVIRLTEKGGLSLENEANSRARAA